MAVCPHCGENGVGVIAKWWSTAALPAYCRLCDRPSYAARSGRAFVNGALDGVAGGLVLASPLVLLFFPGSIRTAMAALVCMFVLLIGTKIVLFNRTPLVAASEATVREASQWARFGYVILGVTAVAVGLTVWITRAL